MRVLQARFHFFPGDEDPLVVGHIIWSLTARGARPIVRPLFRAGGAQAPIQITSDLRRLVEAAGTNPYHALLNLRSSSWSFVPVSEAAWKSKSVDAPRAQENQSAPGPGGVVIFGRRVRVAEAWLRGNDAVKR